MYRLYIYKDKFNQKLRKIIDFKNVDLMNKYIKRYKCKNIRCIISNS